MFWRRWANHHFTFNHKGGGVMRAQLLAVPSRHLLILGENTKGKGLQYNNSRFNLRPLGCDKHQARVRAHTQRLRRSGWTDVSPSPFSPTHHPSPLTDLQHKKHPLPLLLEWPVTHQVTEKVFADSSDSANFFFPVWAIHSSGSPILLTYVTSTSWWHTATAFLLLTIITQIKKKIKFYSYLRKFREEQLQSHKWGRVS
jgi:hypothetical protein